MRTRHRLLDAEEDALLDDVGACPTPQHIKVARYEDEMLAAAAQGRIVPPSPTTKEQRVQRAERSAASLGFSGRASAARRRVGGEGAPFPGPHQDAVPRLRSGAASAHSPATHPRGTHLFCLGCAPRRTRPWTQNSRALGESP